MCVKEPHAFKTQVLLRCQIIMNSLAQEELDKPHVVCVNITHKLSLSLN